LSRKTQLAYETTLRAIIEKAQGDWRINCHWQKVTVDFELPLALAFKAVAPLVVLGELVLEGCFMHYCSAIVKNMKSFGLASVYTDETTGFRHFIAKIFALAFMPPDAVTDVLNYLLLHKLPESVTNSVHAQALQDFLDYYTSQWVQNGDVPIDVWNVYYRVDHRTNNDLEGLHREFLRYFGVHSDLWSFVRSLKCFQDKKEIVYERHANSGVPPVHQRRGTRRQQSELTQLRGHFESTRKELKDCYDYLVRVSHKMRQYNTGEADDDDDDGDNE
jgi:hypothetical protein